MRHLSADLRYALRTLAKTPGFAVVAVLTLTLAIGVNSSLFTLVHGVLLRQVIPVEPEQVVNLFTARAGASKEAIIGGLIGTVVGVFTGLWGLIFMPFLGAVIGQYIVDRDMIRARDVGFATWLGMAIGTVAKVAIAFLMIGIFIAALLIP